MIGPRPTPLPGQRESRRRVPGSEPRRPVPPPREVRNPAVSLRARFLLYIVLVHVMFAACAVWFLRNDRIWLIAVEVAFVVTLVIGARLTRAFFGPLELIRAGALQIRERDFTTRLTETGQADMDQLIGVYNQMIDTLREERIHGEEQEHLLQKVLQESPGGVVTLDLDGRVATVNPAAERLLGLGRDQLIGRKLDEVQVPVAQELAEMLIAAGPATAAGRTTGPRGERSGDPNSDAAHLLRLEGRRRVRCQGGHLHGPRLSPSLPAAGRADQRAAPHREAGLRETDPHDEPRGEQHQRCGTIVAAVVPGLSPPARRGRPRRLHQRPGGGHPPHGQPGRIHARLRRGGAVAAPAPAPGRSLADRRRRGHPAARPPGRRRHRMARRGGRRPARGSLRPGAAGAGTASTSSRTRPRPSRPRAGRE